MLTRFSILMPVVKTRHFKEAFNSAVAQNYYNYEIVVVDNKADGDVSWVLQNPKVRLIQNKVRIPPAENWNMGIEACAGEWIVLLSDDDLLTENALFNVNASIEKNGENFDLIRTLRETISESGEFIAYTCPSKEIESMDEYVYNQFTFKRGQAISDIFFRKSSALAIGGFKDLAYVWGTDHIFAIEVASIRNKVLHVNEICMKYRVHNQSISGLISVDVILAKLGADDIWSNWAIKYLDKVDEGIYKNASISAMKLHRQGMQDGHYEAMAKNTGLWALYQLNKLNKYNLGSKKRSLGKGVSAWLGKLTKSARKSP